MQLLSLCDNLPQDTLYIPLLLFFAGLCKPFPFIFCRLMQTFKRNMKFFPDLALILQKIHKLLRYNWLTIILHVTIKKKKSTQTHTPVCKHLQTRTEIFFNYNRGHKNVGSESTYHRPTVT